MKDNKVLNYHISIDKEIVDKKTVYNAHCASLGLADFGDTIDEAIEHIRSLIEFHVETLAQLGKPIPVEKESTSVITSISIPLPPTTYPRGL